MIPSTMDIDAGLRTIAGLHGFVVDFWVSPPAGRIEEVSSTPDSSWTTVHLNHTFAWGLHGRATGDRPAFAVAFEVTAEAEIEARLIFGSFDGFVAELNGEVVAAPEPNAAPAVHDNAFVVWLKQGANAFRIKVDSEVASPFFGVRVAGPDGEPLSGVCVTNPPPSTRTEAVVTSFEYFNRLLCEEPELGFRGSTRSDWRDWHEAFRSRLMECMGPFPERPAPEGRVIERVEFPAYVREKVLVRSEPEVWVPAWVLIPRRPNGRTALCLHGHSDGVGKVVGVNDTDPDVAASIERFNYDYGRQLAQRGYAVMNPVFRCFGERRGPVHLFPGKDYCDATFMKAVLLGLNLLTLDIHDAQCCLDYLCTRPEVDPDRIGCLGLSYGGRTTTFLTAVDERIQAAVISGALNTFRERAVHGGSCGSQFIRGLLRFGDVPEVIGAIAPRPVLIELGKGDGCCPEIVATAAYERIERIYAAADVPDRLDIDIFDGGHRFSGRKAFAWLDRWV